MATNTTSAHQVETATLCALIMSIERLTLALDRHVDHCPGWPGSKPFPVSFATGDMVDPLSEDFDPTLLNTGRHPDVIAAGLAEVDSVVGAWYVVTSGREPGVYQHSEEVSYHTVGVPRSASKKHGSQTEAFKAYQRAWALGAIQRIV